MSGRVVSGSTSGPKTYLSPEEVTELVKLRCTAMGYPKFREEALALVRRNTVTQVGGGSNFVAGTQILLSGHLHHLLGDKLARQIQKLRVVIFIF